MDDLIYWYKNTRLNLVDILIHIVSSLGDYIFLSVYEPYIPYIYKNYFFFLGNLQTFKKAPIALWLVVWDWACPFQRDWIAYSHKTNQIIFWAHCIKIIMLVKE